jgi:hypothetical protein
MGGRGMEEGKKWKFGPIANEWNKRNDRKESDLWKPISMGERVVDKSRIRPNEINGSTSNRNSTQSNLGNRSRPLVRPSAKSVPPVRTGRVADRSEMQKESNSWENRRIESRGGWGGEKLGGGCELIPRGKCGRRYGDMEMWERECTGECRVK